MRITKLLSIAALVLAFIGGCQSPEIIQEEIVAVTPSGDYRLMTPAYYRDSKAGDAIQVRFYESPRIFDLVKDHPAYTRIVALLDQAIESKNPVRVYVGSEITPYASMQDAAQASAEEIQLNAQKYEIEQEPAAMRKAVPNMTILNGIFDYCAAQGCATGTAEIDYCIPFQYVVDGCYARAHKMRQIMINEYNLVCEKVFSYEGAGAGSLAVDAGDCCVFWWYHVAPLVSVKSVGGGVTKYVVDPSMFSDPVSIDTWTSAQENTSCTPWANFGYYEITPGYIYTPGGGTDPTYSSTNWTLAAYADLETCD